MLARCGIHHGGDHHRRRRCRIRSVLEMHYGLEGRIAIVSGGSRGIGKAIARTLGNEGASVMLAARNQSDLDDTAAELEALAPGRVDVVAADMTDPASVDRVVAATHSRFGS